MNPHLISPAVAAFFAFLAAVFLILSFTRGSAPAKKTWLRIGVIFAVVALITFAVRPK